MEATGLAGIYEEKVGDTVCTFRQKIFPDRENSLYLLRC